MTAICIFFHCIILSNSLFIGILYKLYFDHLRLLMSLDVEENTGLKASRRSFRIVYANVLGLLKNLSDSGSA